MPFAIPKGFHKTLGFRLSAWYSAVFILSSLIFSSVSYLFVFSTVRDNRAALRGALARYEALVDSEGVRALANAMAEQPSPSRRSTFFVRVVDAESRTRFVSHPALWAKFDFADPKQPPLEGEWQYYTSKRDGDLLEVATAGLGDGSLLQVGKSIQDREEVIERFGETLLATIIPMVLIGLAGGAVLAFRALRPLRNLSAVTRSIVDTGRFDARVPDNQAGDELNELVVLFNQMLARIEALVAGMKEALDNVAHDLRTPVARLRMVAEEALRSEGTTVAKREALADCLEESERLMMTLNALMDISEAESGAMKLTLDEVRLTALIDDVIELYRYVAEENQVSLLGRSAGDLSVRADGARLRQVLANLVDNAIKYTPAGGRVEIAGSLDEDKIVVAVRDTGIGIPEQEMARIWERLYRGDKSRSQRGLGLGLSLVQAVIRAHGGQVEVSTNRPAGTCFTVTLPRRPKV